MSEHKRHLRAVAREARRALSERERAEAASAVTARTVELLAGRKPSSVLGYVATAEEIDPELLLEALRSAGLCVALPRVTGPARLALHWVTPSDELVAGPYGILEPADELPVADSAEIDVALVPGVAFDTACNRIGYGGCFYDNLLPRLRPDALKIGLAFDVQLVEAVPAEEHDVALDFVVTPAAVFAAEE